MKLEIIRTFINLKSKGHNTVPTNMSVGGFNISLDNKEIQYDNPMICMYSGQSFDNNSIIIECEGRDGNDTFYFDNKEIDKSDYVMEFDKIPEITNLIEIYYEAEDKSRKELLFDIDYYSIIIKVHDTGEYLEIIASNDLIQKYNRAVEKGAR